MGHATTKTTEEHYGRISNDRAISDIEKAWTSSPAAPKETKADLTDKPPSSAPKPEIDAHGKHRASKYGDYGHRKGDEVFHLAV